MLKRSSLCSLTSTDISLAGTQAAVKMPQPIGNADKHRLVKLSDEQGKICVSDWSDISLLDCCEFGDSSAVVDHSSYSSVGMELRRFNLPMNAAKGNERIHQLIDHLYQQQQQHRIERRLRRTLSFSTIAGTIVADTASLLHANQAVFLRHNLSTQTCQQVTRYCQNEALAWQTEVSLSPSEFPNILSQLWQGKMMYIASSWPSSLPTAPSLSDTIYTVLNAAEVAAGEQRRWLSRWPGTWLLVPIRRLPIHIPASIPVAMAANIEGEADYWGLLALSLPQQKTWTQDAISAIYNVTIELAFALQQSQQYHELVAENQELQKLALADGLTSLANRRRFDQHLAGEWQRLARDQQPLSLILCDLDHFKLYNDTFGHQAGDRCLIRVARALLGGPQRPADLVARYGGEEFAIILPNTDTQGAWRIAQKIHSSIHALKIKHAPGHSTAYVTATMGVSTIVPDHGNSSQMLLRASDLALYYAKQQGRNRTYVNGHHNTIKTYAKNGVLADDNGLDIMPSEP